MQRSAAVPPGRLACGALSINQCTALCVGSSVAGHNWVHLGALQEMQTSAADSGIDFRQRLSQVVGDMGQIDWLVPPMLQKA
jgi:hypothetical protein